jgi:lipopolysaccharide export system protein LptC
MNRVAILLLAVASLAAAPGCRAPKPSEAQAVVPELKLDGVRFRVYRGETLRAFGLSDSATLRRDSSEVHAEQLDATLPRGVEPLRITAPAGDGSLLSRVFEVAGGIVAARGDAVARTASARYEPDGGDGIVRGHEPVAVQGPGYRLEGRGFTLDPSGGTIVMKGGARLLAGLAGAAAP